MPACSKSNNVNTSNQTTNVFSKAIDEDGGTVGEVGGLSVYVPRGAVGQPVTISIREAQEGEYPEPPSTLAGKVYAIEPHGLELAAKATVHLPFPEGYQPGFVAAIHAEVGGSWEMVNGGLDSTARTATFETYSFSFFALKDMTVPDTSTAGTGATAMGAGGGASYAGSANGAGGNMAPVEPPMGETDYCSPIAAPVGSSDIAGNVAFPMGPRGFTAVDGLAAKVSMGDRTRLLLTFTDTPQACGAAIAAGSIASPKPVSGGRPGYSVALALDVYTPDTPGQIPAQMTYPRAGQPEMIDAMAFELDSVCREMMGPLAPTATVTIDTFVSDRITGSINLPDDGSGSVLTGTFDLPFCPLPETGGGERCCVEP